MVLLGAWASLALLSGAPDSAALPSSPGVAEACKALKGQTVAGAQVLAADLHEAETITPPQLGGPVKLPAHCRVFLRLAPEAGSDIRTQVWLPLAGWDGRLSAGGNGGFAGSIEEGALATAVRAGQVGMSTDTGHKGGAGDGAWGKDQPGKVRDYGWRAFHVSTVAAKAIAARVFGRAPDHAYLASCSNGGRQALMEAQRYPEDYDGLIAGAPALDWTGVAAALVWDIQALSRPGAHIGPEQASLLQAAVLNACDALDGEKDGVIADPRRCRFDPAVLACGAAAQGGCFNPAQIEALRRIYAGPSTPAGRKLYPGYMAAGAEAGLGQALGWNGWIFAPAGRDSGQAAGPKAMLEDLTSPPLGTIESFDFSRDPQRLDAALGGDLNAKDPDLSRFFARGGKLILWHGWADPGLPPLRTLSYYQDVLKHSGPRASSSVRMFMAPGVLHCFGGPGLNSFGQAGAPPPGSGPNDHLVAALQAWVETGRAPERVNARRRADVLPGAFDPLGGPAEVVGVLCAWPKTPTGAPGRQVCRGPRA